MRNSLSAGPAQVVGLSFAAAFGHCLGEISEQHSEPKPKGDLKLEFWIGNSCDRPDQTVNELERRQHTPDFDYEHYRVLHHRARIQFDERIDNCAPNDRPVPNCFSLRGLCHDYSIHQNVLPAYISRCSTIEPRLSAGQKVSAPTIRITLTSRTVNNGVVTGNVPRLGGTSFLRARLPATASIGTIIRKRPTSIAAPIVELYQ